MKYRKQKSATKRGNAMLIRQDFNSQPQLPPRLYMEQIMDSLSQIYCFLWDHKNEQNVFKMAWKEILVYYSKNTFRTSLRKLNNQGLLSYKEDEYGITIELIGWDDTDPEI